MTPPPKILLVTGSLPPDRCGVGDYTAQLAAALTAAGAEVELAASSTASAAPGLAARITTWRMTGLPSLFAALRRSRADIVHIQYPTAGYDGVWLPTIVPWLAKLAGKRAVVTFHEPQSWTQVRHPRATLRFLSHIFGPGRIVVTRPDFRALLHPVLRRLSNWRRLRYIPIGSNIGRSQLTEPDRADLRAHEMNGAARLVAYFGFVAPNKGIEDLLALIDPMHDRLLLIADLRADDSYHRAIRDRLAPLGNTVKVTGHLPSAAVADLLAAADAVVLPFRGGASATNGTVHAAALQGTYVLTTARDDRAYDDPIRNVELVPRGDIAALRAAFDRHAGRRVAVAVDAGSAAWQAIAADHLSLYAELIPPR